MPKYQILAIVQTEEELTEQDMRRICAEVKETTVTWDIGSSTSFKNRVNIPISITKIKGKAKHHPNDVIILS